MVPVYKVRHLRPYSFFARITVHGKANGDTASRLREFADVLAELTLQVGGFVFGYDVLAAETQKKGAYLVVFLFGLCLVRHLAQTVYQRAAGLGPIAVLKLALFRLTDALL